MATKAASKSGKSNANTKKPSSSSKAASAKKAEPAQRPVRREIGAVVCFFLGLFSFIGYFNVDALFITYFCRFIKGLIGYGYYIFPPALLAAAFILAFHRGRPVRLRVTCVLLLPLVFGALAHVLFAAPVDEELKFVQKVSALYKTGADMGSGGVIAGLLGGGFKAMFSVYGAVPVFIFIIAALFMLAFRISPAKIAQKAKDRPHLEYEPLPEDEPSAPQPSAPAAKPRRKSIDIPIDEDEGEREEYVEKKVGFFNTNPRVKTPDQLLAKHGSLDAQAAAAQEDDSAPWDEPETAPAPSAPARTERENRTGAGFAPSIFKPRTAAAPASAPAAPTPVQPKPKAAEADVKPLSIEEAADIAGVTPVEIRSDEISTAERRPERKRMDAEELRRETEEVQRTIESGEIALQPEYCYPPSSLLRRGSASAVDGREEMALNRERLQSTLHSFGVSATIADVTRGPTVTRYDLELEAGVKLSKLTNLSGDLALALGVTGVRIAPIPDKISTVGIEVPNKIVSTVYLRDIIESDAFKSASSKLTFAIGEDIGGNCICGNIAKLPHMLIAGTTGSGKSVCMNSLILSLLYKATPEEVKLIMIDPKMVELGIYNGIPHLYIPVVTDPKKAAGSLQWAVVEMLKRYRMFSEVGVRDIASFNSHRRKNGEDTIPQVVIVIDELADLMLVASKEVEESICRVAQMGRAAGMHLVIATQRPSADVITGLMKANIPSRIAFAVASAMESRIILDQQGAEKLVGSGDMLYAPIGCHKPMRIQGAFVSDEERENVVEFVKQNGSAQYNEEIMQQIEKAAEDKTPAKAESAAPEEEHSSFDELLPQAVDVIFETKQASVSMLQRRLKLGYSRAARIVDQMEELGVVGPFEGSKPRQILITREQWQEMQLLSGTAPEEKLQDDMKFDEYQDDAPEDWGDE